MFTLFLMSVIRDYFEIYQKLVLFFLCIYMSFEIILLVFRANALARAELSKSGEIIVTMPGEKKEESDQQSDSDLKCSHENETVV